MPRSKDSFSWTDVTSVLSMHGRKALLLSPATKTSWFLIEQCLVYFFLLICKNSFVPGPTLCRHSIPCRQGCALARDLESCSSSGCWQQKIVKYQMSFDTLHRLWWVVISTETWYELWIFLMMKPENSDSLEVFT